MLVSFYSDFLLIKLVSWSHPSVAVHADRPSILNDVRATHHLENLGYFQ